MLLQPVKTCDINSIFLKLSHLSRRYIGRCLPSFDMFIQQEYSVFPNVGHQIQVLSTFSHFILPIGDIFNIPALNSTKVPLFTGRVIFERYPRTKLINVCNLSSPICFWIFCLAKKYHYSLYKKQIITVHTYFLSMFEIN